MVSCNFVSSRTQSCDCYTLLLFILYLHGVLLNFFQITKGLKQITEPALNQARDK